MKKYLILLITLVFIFSCKDKSTTKTIKTPTTSNIKYATGFDIVTEGNVKKLVIKKPYKNAKKQFTYTLTNKTDFSKLQLKVPITNVVVTSTTHIPMLELIGAEKYISGFPQTKFISSKKTRNLVDNGTIVELGTEQQINTEKLLALSPELVIGFALNGNNKTYNTISKNNIPVLYNGDWLEETPLGRAEWIKFFGVLFGKEKQADSIFNVIEKNYNEVKKWALKAPKKPTIISGSLFKDVWYMPAGDSFIASYFKDANTHYLWQDSRGTGSLSLSIESVVDKGLKADYWIGCGLLETKKGVQEKFPNYVAFSAFKEDRVFTYAIRKGATGGLIYFEKSPTRPDLMLKDIIKITHPELLPNYELTFFDKLK
ncbi:ABC transporter substrate-binding protein [Polaribacter batillariae]|uniref:ABC transporter substrate-binding protein n=1 Tax=Polaribacter batillariae TaxID=2808900 RepID=A0ABX7SVD1_9FLAO|nr:ABC transporter substrate-binding protein [Polaribacter batillariae]QTD37842.1 ABC transporter substrate-binding protein [Polaribacter batillariae]